MALTQQLERYFFDDLNETRPLSFRQFSVNKGHNIESIRIKLNKKLLL